MKDKLFRQVEVLLKRCYRFIMWVIVIYKNTLKRRNLEDIDPKYKKEIRTYWRKYKRGIHLRDFRWYQSKGALKNVRIITDAVFHASIEPHYNDITILKAFSNKCYFNLFFNGFLVPYTIAKRINGVYVDDNFNLLKLNEVIDLCRNESEIVMKPALDSGGGRNIAFYNIKDGKIPKKLEDEIRRYKSDFVIQRRIIQHEELSKINSSSLNTVRVQSFLFHGNVYILSFLLRFGKTGATVDNLSRGGISVAIDKFGHFFPIGYDDLGNQYVKHPNGYVFEGKVLPGFDKIIECVKKLHPRFPNFGFIGWDIAVNQDCEPVIVEFNLIDTCIHAGQIAYGPLFQELTDEVLDEVFHKKRKRCQR